MRIFLINLKRNIKLFFKDKGVFFTSLITPLILLLLYVTFLGNVFKDTFLQIFTFQFTVLKLPFTYFFIVYPPKFF